MLEAAAGQQHRQVRRRMITGVAQVAAEEHHRPIEQTLALFLRLLQLGEQVAQGLHQLKFEELKLLD